MKRQNAKDLIKESEEIRNNLRKIGEVTLDMINQIRLTQGKDELWEKAVEINKIAEKMHIKLQRLETKICFQVISDSER